jgi:hypothetical protein
MHGPLGRPVEEGNRSYREDFLRVKSLKSQVSQLRGCAYVRERRRERLDFRVVIKVARRLSMDRALNMSLMVEITTLLSLAL